MANIPIRDIPGAVQTSPSASALLPMDNGIAMEKTTVQAIVDSGAPVASKSEAEAGTDNTKRMTALRVKESIAAEVGQTIASSAQGDKADSAVQPSRAISAGTGLVGGGDLSANRSFALSSTALASLALADTAVQPARAVTAGAGLTGGGSLAEDRTISLSTATQASLALADSAVQPGDLGALATKDTVSVGDIVAAGSPNNTTYLRGDGTWATPAGGQNNTNAFVSSRAAMKALDTNSITSAYLTEPGREGQFIWRTGDYSAMITLDTLEGVYVAPASDPTGASGAWVRQYDNHVNAAWFGFSESGSATDNKTALQRAIDLCAALGGGIVQLSGGTYNIQTGIVIGPSVGVGITIKGEQKFSTVLVVPDDDAGTLITLNGWKCNCEDFSITSTNYRAGTAIILGASNTIANRILISRQGIGIQLLGVLSKVLNCTITHVPPSTGEGIRVSGGDTSQVIHNTFVKGADIENQPYAGIRLRDSMALRISDSDVLVAGAALRIDPRNSELVASLKVVNCHFDTSNVACLIQPEHTASVVRLDFSNSWFGNSRVDDGMKITGIWTSGIIEGITLTACDFHLNTQSGVSLTKMRDINFIGCRMSSNANGIYCNADVSDVVVVGCSIGDYEGGSGNTNVGISVHGTTDKYAIVGNKLEGNGGAAISGGSISSSKVIKDNIGFVTEARGSATIVAASTSVVVSHGLNITPASIALTPSSNIGNATKYWISAKSSTQFTITVDVAPGANIGFLWSAQS